MTFGMMCIIKVSYWITLETLRSLFYYTVTTVHNTQKNYSVIVQ